MKLNWLCTIILIIIVISITVYFLRRESYFDNRGQKKWSDQETNDFVRILGNLCTINPEKKNETINCILNICQKDYNGPSDIIPARLDQIVKECMSKCGCKNQPSYDSPAGSWDKEQIRLLEYVLNKGEINSRIKKCVLEKVPRKYSYVEFMNKLSQGNSKELETVFRGCKK